MHGTALTVRDQQPVRVLVARDAAIEAEFAPALGMVCCSLTHRGDQLLGQRGGLAAYAERGSTMGVPLLHPWANRLSGLRYAAAGREVELERDSPLLHLDGNGLPIHGLLARHLPFQVIAHDASEQAAWLTARFESRLHPAVLEVFPFPHELEVEARLEGTRLTMRTTLTALDGPVPVAFGYHPYLQLPDVDRTEWRVSAPLTTRLVLDSRMIPTGRREPVRPVEGALGAREFDNAFADIAEGTRCTVSGGGRTLAVSLDRGYGYAQLFAPPGQRLICFEPMTAPTNALVDGRGLQTLTAGERHTGEFSISIA